LRYLAYIYPFSPLAQPFSIKYTFTLVLYLYAVTIPDFVVGSFGCKFGDLEAFVNSKGYINFDILKGKESGSLYVKVSDYGLDKPEKTVTKIAPVKDIISAAILAERNGTHTTNNETYALKVQKLEKAMKEMEEMINSFNADDSEEDTPDPKNAAKKDAKKMEDKKEEDDKK
jgi:hypothetical protein